MTHTSEEVRHLIELAHISSPEYRALVEQAWFFAWRAYGNKQKAGIFLREHAFETAKIVAALDLGPTTITAALLHSVLLHTDVPEDAIREKFGERTLSRLQALKAVSVVQYKDDRAHAESMLSFFIAASEDLRVLIIKITERLARMRKTKVFPRNISDRVLKETMTIYVPLAHRLNLWPIARELEDRCFKLSNPDAYRFITREITAREKRSEKALSLLKKEFLSLLKKAGIKEATTETRIKSAWSTFQKLKQKGATTELFDMKAVRIILQTEEECYRALDVIHRKFKPIPGRVKDYIAYPKVNGYQSLHTTVVLADESRAEIQIRTKRMHEFAQFGVAAHENYKHHNQALLTKQIRRFFPPPETSSLPPVPEARLRKVPSFIRELVDVRAYISDPFNEGNKGRADFWHERMFIFDEHDAVIELPLRATVLDFAFAASPSRAARLSGAKVNGKPALVETELKNGDTVKLATSKSARPHKSWLSAARTELAKAQIKAALE
ncbi:MAG: HD domain-containing protein [bacterium]|nr:HD domain-containing protein [bacterium]